jgi:hypothetical protein
MSAHCMSAHRMSAHVTDMHVGASHVGALHIGALHVGASHVGASHVGALHVGAQCADIQGKKDFLHSFRPGAEQTAASKRFHGQRRQSSGCLHFFWAPSCVHDTAYRPSPPRHALPCLRGQSATSRTNVSARASKQRRAGQMSAGTK